MKTETKESVVVYVHICSVCGKRWTDTKKVSECHRCGQNHIWFNGTSFLRDVK